MNHANVDPSPWVMRWLPALKPASEVLDLACGHGRHARLLASAGHQVMAVDRSEEALTSLRATPGIQTLCADVEANEWPLSGRRFDVVLVTNYLHRPLWAHLAEAVAPEGWLIYETFMLGNERYGKPSNPDFLLRPGELLQVAQSMEVVAFEQGLFEGSAVIQRICARRGGATAVSL